MCTPFYGRKQPFWPFRKEAALSVVQVGKPYGNRSIVNSDMFYVLEQQSLKFRVWLRKIDFGLDYADKLIVVRDNKISLYLNT
jgi:hypothetical protein